MSEFSSNIHHNLTAKSAWYIIYHSFGTVFNYFYQVRTFHWEFSLKPLKEMVIIFHIRPSRRRGYHAVFEVQCYWEILPKMFLFKVSKNYKYLVKSKPLCYSLCCVLFYSALLEKTYSASFVSPLYLNPTLVPWGVCTPHIF